MPTADGPRRWLGVARSQALPGNALPPRLRLALEHCGRAQAASKGPNRGPNDLEAKPVGPLFGPHVGPHLFLRFPQQFRCFSHQGAKGPNFLQKGVAALRKRPPSLPLVAHNHAALRIPHALSVKSQIRNPNSQIQLSLSPPFSKTVNLSFPDHSARIAATPCRPTRRIFLACRHLSTDLAEFCRSPASRLA